ncbi:MAG: TolC family protein [Myxococcota bacterium]
MSSLPVVVGLLLSAASDPPSALSLQDALALAEQHDARLLRSRISVEVSRARALQETLRLLPVVDLGASLTQNPREVSANGRVVTPLTVPQGTAQGRFTLIDGQAVPGAVASVVEDKAFGLEQREGRDALRADVATAYLALAEAQALTDAAARATATARELLRVTEARARLGDALLLDVQAARAEVLRLEADEANVTGLEMQAAALLALRLGVDDTEGLHAQCDSCVPLPPRAEVGAVTGVDVTLSLPARTDLQALRLRYDAAEWQKAGSWFEFVPELALVGNARLQQPTLFTPDPLWWSAQVVASWRLFEGGARAMRVKERGARSRAAAGAAARGADEAAVEVRQAEAALDAALAAERAATARVELSEAALAQARLRYEQGLLSAFDISEVARRAAEADAQGIQSRFRRERAVLRLRRALGLGVLDDGEQG